jgi:hypothetical protein
MPKPIHELAPDVPGGLADVVMALLEKDPNARYQRGHDVADAIYHWMHEMGIHDEPPVRASRSS